MAGEMERDARLILRAEDRASKTFDQVATSIKRVRQEIADNAKAVAAGTGDLQSYNRALDELKAAGDALIQGQSLINQFQKQGEAIGKAEDRLRNAEAALDAYRAKIGTAQPNDTQAVQIEKKIAKVTNAQANLERVQQRLNEIVGRMERAGIATDNLEAQFDQMASAAVEAAQGIAAAKAAIDDYPNAVKRATDAAEEFKAAQTFAGKDTSFLAPAEFGFIQSLDGAKAKLAELVQYEQLEARSAANAAAAEKQRRSAQIAGINEVLRGNDALDAQFKELIADEARLRDLNAFRQLGTDAAESAVKVDRYAASVSNLGNDFRSFAAEVRTAIGGTSSSLQDIGQALSQIDSAAETLNSPKLAINDLQASAGKLTIAIATLDRTARQIDGFRQQQAAVEAAEAAFAEAQQEVVRLGRAMSTADEPSEALAADLAQAQRELVRAGDAMQKVRTDAVKMGDGLRRAGIDTDNLEAEMTRLRTSAVTAGTTLEGLNAKTRGRGGFLGLNPFELQNLGFQVNDVFTQLASGTPVFQVVAQQGGQIIQLFRGLGSTLLRLAPIIGGVVLVLSPFIAALGQASQAADAVRTANTLLAGTGLDGVRESAAAYTEASITLQNLGNTAKDTTEVLKTFRDSGLGIEGLDQFILAVDNAAKGGADLADTATLLADALGGGVDEVEALNDKFHILTAAEEAQIAKMIESGQESEARRIIYEKFEQTAQRMADSARGPWSKAWDELGFAFNNFSRTVQQSSVWGFLRQAFKAVIFDIDEARGAMEGLAYFFNYASKRGLFGTIKDGVLAATGNLDPNALSDAQRKAAAFANAGGRPRGRGGQYPVPGENQQDTLEGNRAIRDRTRALEEAEAATKKLSRAETAAAARREALRTAKGSPAQREQQADLAEKAALVKFDDAAAKAAAAAAKREAAAGRRSTKAAETLANQRRAIEEQLIRDLDALEAKVDKTSVQSLQDRLEAVDKGYTGLFQKIEEFKRKGGSTIDGQTVAEYEKAARAQLEVLRNQEQMKFYEESINALLKDRADQITGVEDQLGRGDITPADATAKFEEIISGFAPRVSELTAEALKFAQSLRTAVPNPKLEAMISKFERISQQNSAGQDRNLAKSLAQSVIDDESKKLDEIIRQRDALVAAENTLVELGVKSRVDAQGAIETAYARTTPLIRDQAAVLQSLLDEFVATYPEMQTFYDTWQAKLQGIAATTDYVDARFTQLKGGIDSLITGNALAGIDAMAQAFARLALGQQGALATLKDLGIAFANFIAETLIGISKLILQMILLSAIEKVTGIPVGALLKFMNASGLHTGGIVGQQRTFSRRVPEAAFYGAPRYHGGGVAGFAPDEVPAILKRNEEVLTTADPRHRFNLGAGEADAVGPVAQRNILVLDPRELAGAMAGPAGEKMIINHIRRNRTTIKQMVND